MYIYQLKTKIYEIGHLRIVSINNNMIMIRNEIILMESPKWLFSLFLQNVVCNLREQA